MESNGWIWSVVSINDTEYEHIIYVIAETMPEAIVCCGLPEDCIATISRVGHVESIAPALVKGWSEARGRWGGT